MPVRCSLAHATALATALAEKKEKTVEKGEEDGLALYQKEQVLLEDIVTRLQNTSTGSMYMSDLGREIRSRVTGLGKRLQTILLSYPHLVKLKGVRVELVKKVEENDPPSSDESTESGPDMQRRMMEDNMHHPYGRVADESDIHPIHRAMADRLAEMHEMYAMYAQMYSDKNYTDEEQLGAPWESEA